MRKEKKLVSFKIMFFYYTTNHSCRPKASIEEYKAVYHTALDELFMPTNKKKIDEEKGNGCDCKCNQK